jgi:hypothetical protein
MATSKAKVQELLGDLKKVIERLSPDNAGMALTSFIQIAEIFRLRQLRLGKTVLKRSMVIRAWELLAYHHEKCFTFRCEGALLSTWGTSQREMLSMITGSTSSARFKMRTAGPLASETASWFTCTRTAKNATRWNQSFINRLAARDFPGFAMS